MQRKIYISIIITVLILFSAAFVQAQSVPLMPALCYGELTIDGKPAPVGTLVVAKVDGVNKGSLETTKEGAYGGPGLETKLTVTTEGSQGKYVRFYISGSFQGKAFNDLYVKQVMFWGSGQTKQIDLHAELGTTEPAPSPDPDPGTDPDPGNGTSPPPGNGTDPDPSNGTSPSPGNGTDPDPDEGTDSDSETDTDPDEGSVEAPEADPETGIALGDINSDGFINVRDITLVMQYVLNLIELDENQQLAADVNGDGKIDVQDVSLMMQYALGLIDSFE